MTPIEKAAAYVVSIYKKEVGYHEKASNANLDSPSANSGSNNWNKYAAHIDSFRAQGYNFYNGKKNIGAAGEWCDIFYDDGIIVAVQSLGLSIEVASQMLYQPIDSCGAGCKYSANYYRAAGAWIARNGEPKIGDQIFFGKLTDESHTGAVVGVDGVYVYTIEGNANNRVEERKYSRSDGNIAGYGRPNYELIAYKFVEPATPEDPIKDDETSLSAAEIAQISALVDKKLDEALGPFIKTIDQLPAWGRREMRLILDCGAIDGGTPADENPDDIGMRQELIRVLIGAKRFTFYELGQVVAPNDRGGGPDA